MFSTVNSAVQQDSVYSNDGDAFDESISEREKQILFFCELQIEKIRRALAKTYKDGKDIGKLDETKKRLAKLGPARLALQQIIRAIKKRDYMLLASDSVTEVDRARPVAPEIA